MISAPVKPFVNWSKQIGSFLGSLRKINMFAIRKYMKVMAIDFL